MITLNYTSRFKKELRTALKRGCKKELFEFVVNEPANGRTLEAKYCDHALSRTGTHSDLFGKNRK